MINPVYPTLITGSITGCRVSNVASYYFLDNLPAAVLQFAGSGDQMHIYDGSKWKVVTLGALGTGESLDSERFVDPGFDNSALWTTGGGVSISGNKLRFSSVTAGSGAYETIGHTRVPYGLFKMGITIDSISSGTVSVYHCGYSSSLTYGSPATVTEYVTTPSGSDKNELFRATPGGTAVTAVMDSITSKQVLAPSTSGLWYTPVSEESGWNPNAATHTYRILARRIASGNGGYYK